MLKVFKDGRIAAGMVMIGLIWLLNGCQVISSSPEITLPAAVLTVTPRAILTPTIVLPTFTPTPLATRSADRPTKAQMYWLSTQTIYCLSEKIVYLDSGRATDRYYQIKSITNTGTVSTVIYERTYPIVYEFMNEETGDSKTINNGLRGLALSPDKQILAFFEVSYQHPSAKNHSIAIWTIHIDGTHLQRRMAMNLPKVPVNVTWSPEGDRLGFVLAPSHVTQPSDVAVFNLKDGQLTVYKNFSDFYFLPHTSDLILVSNVNERISMGLHRARGKDTELILPVSDYFAFALSPDGSNGIYKLQAGGELSHFDVQTLQVVQDGGVVNYLDLQTLEMTPWEGLPADRINWLEWSPQGRYVAIYYRDEDGGRLALTDVKTSQTQFFKTNFLFYPQWSTDEKALLLRNGTYTDQGVFFVENGATYFLKSINMMDYWELVW